MLTLKILRILNLTLEVFFIYRYIPILSMKNFEASSRLYVQRTFYQFCYLTINAININIDFPSFYGPLSKKFSKGTFYGWADSKCNDRNTTQRQTMFVRVTHSARLHWSSPFVSFSLLEHVPCRSLLWIDQAGQRSPEASSRVANVNSGASFDHSRGMDDDLTT